MLFLLLILVVLVLFSECARPIGNALSEHPHEEEQIRQICASQWWTTRTKVGSAIPNRKTSRVGCWLFAHPHATDAVARLVVVPLVARS